MLSGITFEVHAQGSSDLVVTEIMSHWPPDGDKRLLISQVNRSDNNNWFQVHNPFDTNLAVLKLTLAKSSKDLVRGKTLLQPGDQHFYCTPKSCDDLPEESVSADTVEFDFEASDGIRLLSSKQGNYDHIGVDALGWGKGVEALFREDVALDSGNTRLRRKRNASGCAIDTQSNVSDFLETQTRSWSYEQCLGPAPEDQNEYIELYNAGDRAVDPVAKGYRLRDSLNDAGEQINRWYEIVGFPHYPHTQDTELKPGQVGLIIRPNADTPPFSDLDWSTIRSLENPPEMLEGTLYQDISDGKVKLYTTRRNGELSFLTDGLHNKKMERITFNRPGKVPPEVNILQLGDDWIKKVVEPFEARVKRNITGPNTKGNWSLRMWGSPGRVEK